jgi:hypothetical protein
MLRAGDCAYLIRVKQVLKAKMIVAITASTMSKDTQTQRKLVIAQCSLRFLSA